MNGLGYLLLLFASGFAVVGMAVPVLVLAYKGFGIGFVSACIIRSMGGGSGILVNLSVVLPQNLLFIPILIFFSAESMQFSFELFRLLKRKGGQRSFKEAAVLFVFKAVVAFLLLSVASLVTAILLPVAMKAAGCI
jgi:stage II sporulation protein M